MLRMLKKEDAPLMLEWMHDANVGGKLAADFEHMTIENCIGFIESATLDEKNLHRAICGEDGEYLGTISLKNIDEKNANAEYAICMRTKSIGTGMSRIATDEILEIAFRELKLRKVYLCVFEQNIRAVKFYKKYGFVYEGTFRQHSVSKENPEAYNDLMWFSMLNTEYDKKARG